MTESYNVSHISAVDYLKDECYSIKGIDKIERFYHKNDKVASNFLLLKDFFVLADTIKNVISEDYVKLNKLRKYLKNIAKICNMLDLIIP